MEKLLTEVSSEHLRLLAESFLNMVHELLQSNDHFFQNLAANSVSHIHKTHISQTLCMTLVKPSISKKFLAVVKLNVSCHFV